MPKAFDQGEFHDLFEADALTLAWIGTSGIGKSSLTRKLVNVAGFESIGIDDMIEHELEPELAETGLEPGIGRVASWLGEPDDPGFAERQQRYLDLETGAMRSVADGLHGGSNRKQGLMGKNGNLIIDTTGSFGQTDPGVQQAVQEVATLVYLQATPGKKKQIMKKYAKDPKPVVWGDGFTPLPGETREQTQERCYSELIDRRHDIYAPLADITIAKTPAVRQMGAWTLLGLMRDKLSKDKQ